MAFFLDEEHERARGWQILKLAGVPFFLEPAFLFFMLIVFLLTMDFIKDPVFSGLACFAVFFSLLIHEAGHALVSRLCGLKAVWVRLVFFGGLTHHEPTTHGRNLMISLAGPFATLLIIIGMAIAIKLGEVGGVELDRRETFLRYVLGLNAFWLIFNLLPVYPLDGGQSVFYFLGLLIHERRALLVVAAISIIVSLLVAYVAYRQNWFFAAIFMIIYAVQNFKLLNTLRGH